MQRWRAATRWGFDSITESHPCRHFTLPAHLSSAIVDALHESISTSGFTMRKV
jgi:hypothetical protein